MDNSTNNQQLNDVVKKKKKWIVPVIIAVVLVIAVVTAAVLYAVTTKPAKKLRRQLDIADKYLSDMDYENAILAYEKALEIDSGCEEGYVGIGKSYLALAENAEAEGDLEKALEYLRDGKTRMEQGLNQTDSDAIKDELKRIEDAIERIEEQIEQEKTQNDENEILSLLAEALADGKYKEAIDYTFDDAFLETADSVADGNPLIEETAAGTVGIYRLSAINGRVNTPFGWTEIYSMDGDQPLNSQLYVYFGGYAADGKRDGEGIWFLADAYTGAYTYDDNGEKEFHGYVKDYWLYTGTFANDLPNGSFTLYNNNQDVMTKALTGDVVNGLYHGHTYWHPEYYGPGDWYDYENGVCTNPNQPKDRTAVVGF